MIHKSCQFGIGTINSDEVSSSAHREMCTIDIVESNTRFTHTGSPSLTQALAQENY